MFSRITLAVFSRITLAATLLVLPAAALAELAGTWTITSEGRRGPQESTLVIVAADGTHSGSITGPRGRKLEISRIDVTGEQFSFDNEVSTRMGDFTLTYAGTAKGDAMQGSIQTPMGERPFTGKRAASE